MHANIQQSTVTSILTSRVDGMVDQRFDLGSSKARSLQSVNWQLVLEQHFQLCHMEQHCGTFYSNCGVIGHFTCQTAMSLGRVWCRIVSRPFFFPEGWGLGTKLDHRSHAMTVTWWQFQPTICLAHWLLHTKEYNRAPKILLLSGDIEINPGPLKTYTRLLLYPGCVHTNCGSRLIFIC